jgi:hypothetical protein
MPINFEHKLAANLPARRIAPLIPWYTSGTIKREKYFIFYIFLI